VKSELHLRWDNVLVVWIAGAIATILLVSGSAFSSDTFYSIFVTVYPWAFWFLVIFFSVSITSVIYAAGHFLKGSNTNTSSIELPSNTRNYAVPLMIFTLMALFVIPYAITRSSYALPGGDTVFYIYFANGFQHYGIVWSFLNDPRPFIDVVFALTITLLGFFKLADQTNYLLSASAMMIMSVTLMVGASFVILLRNGFDKVTIFVAMLLTLSSVQTFQLNNGQYANALALSFLYLSLWVLDRMLMSQRLVEVIMLSGLGVLSALTHVETFAISSVVILISTLSISMRLSASEAKKNLTKLLKVFLIELVVLSPFVGLSLFEVQYFGAFSTYLGNVHARYFAAFPGISGAPPPPAEFDKVALLSLAVQYGNIFTYAALVLSFPVLALRFKRKQHAKSDVYALVWSGMIVIGAITAYVLSSFWSNPNFPGLLLTRRFLFLLPLPFLYSAIVDFLRRF